jgi:hypothetical protein
MAFEFDLVLVSCVMGSGVFLRCRYLINQEYFTGVDLRTGGLPDQALLDI